MAAAVLQGRRLALLVEEQDDVLAEQLERLRPVLEGIELLGGVPEATEDFLLGGQHAPILLIIRRVLPNFVKFRANVARAVQDASTKNRAHCCKKGISG